MEITTQKTILSCVPQLSIVFKNKVPLHDLYKVCRSEDAIDLFRDIYDKEQTGWVETVYLIALNRANKVIGYCEISKGGICGTVVDCRVVFAYLILACADAFIICHNHPSGNIEPSVQDDKITKQLRDAGKLMNMTMTDHIILTETDSYSYVNKHRLELL